MDLELIEQASGQIVRLASFKKPLVGGEGEVLEVSGRPNLVAKVYHPGKEPSLQKLDAMLRNPPNQPAGQLTLAWPVDVLFAHDTAAFRGYLMPKVMASNKIFDFYNPETRRTICHAFSYAYLARTARNLAIAMDCVHRAGHLVGDFNESNALVSLEALVTLVDTDSFQITDQQSGVTHKCLVGKGAFAPPELQGHAFGSSDRKRNQDLFALAVLVFQLLMEGAHPFHAKYTGNEDPEPSLEEQIKRGHYPHGAKNVPYAASIGVLPLTMLSDDLQSLFRRCFEDGHADPDLRPGAGDWVQALEAFESSFTKCPAKGDLHIYRSAYSSCPWCERMQRGLPDVFSPPTNNAQVVQRPLKKLSPATVTTAPVHAQITPGYAGLPIPQRAPVPSIRTKSESTWWWFSATLLFLGVVWPGLRISIEVCAVIAGGALFLSGRSRRLVGSVTCIASASLLFVVPLLSRRYTPVTSTVDTILVPKSVQIEQTNGDQMHNHGSENVHKMPSGREGASSAAQHLTARNPSRQEIRSNPVRHFTHVGIPRKHPDLELGLRLTRKDTPKSGRDGEGHPSLRDGSSLGSQSSSPSDATQGTDHPTLRGGSRLGGG